MTVSAISPYSGGNAGNVTIEIDGTNFTPSATASLTLGGTTINASAIDFVNASQIFATFNLAGAAVGSYTLKVQQGGPVGDGPDHFPGGRRQPGVAERVLITPQYIRSGRTGTIVITYANTTSNDIVAPLLDISSTNADVFFSTPDDPNDYTQDAQVLAVAPSGPAGILRPGQSGQLTLTLLSNDTIDGDPIPVQVSQIEAGQTIDWARRRRPCSRQHSRLRPGTSSTATSWPLSARTTDSYNAALAQAATYLGGLGEPTAQVSDVTRSGRSWSPRPTPTSRPRR